MSSTKILIVDDDPDIVESMTIILENKGYQVASALGPEEGLLKVRAERPDLIILDVMMPEGAEGFQFVWKLRQDPDLGCEKTPVLVVTSVNQKSEIRFSPDMQDSTYAPREYLPVQDLADKPIQPEDLLAKVAALVGP